MPRRADEKIRDLMDVLLSARAEATALEAQKGSSAQHVDDAWTRSERAWSDIIELFWQNRLQPETHRLIASKFPFSRGSQIPLYARDLIWELHDEAIPLIRDLLLRGDIEVDASDAAEVIRLLAALVSSGSAAPIGLPGGEKSAERARRLDLGSLRPLSGEPVAEEFAAPLLGMLRFRKNTPEAQAFYESNGGRPGDRLDCASYLWAFAGNVAGLLALRYGPTPSVPVNSSYAARLADSSPGFFGLTLFYKLLRPAQTEDILRAILHLADGKGLYLARTRGIPEARAHFQRFLDRPNSYEGKTAWEWVT